MLACVLNLFPVCVCRVAVVQAISFQRKTLSYMLLVNPGNLFSINQESGALSLTRTVDYESGQHLHHLQVKASEPDTGLSNMAEVSPYLPSYLNRVFPLIFIALKCIVLKLIIISSDINTFFNNFLSSKIQLDQKYTHNLFFCCFFSHICIVFTNTPN